MRFSSVLLAIAVLPAWAGGLTQDERDYALSQLHATRKMVLDTIAGANEAQWKFKPAPDRWSIAEIAEHLILTEDMLMEMVKKGLTTEAVPNRKVEHEADEKLYQMVKDRTEKRTAPAGLAPGGEKWPTPKAASAEFAARRDRTLEYVRTTQDDLRAHPMKMGERESDPYQLLLVMAAHVERHLEQAKEVMADPKYPK